MSIFGRMTDIVKANINDLLDRAEDPEVAIKPVHKMSEAQVRREMQAAGFKHVKTVRTLPLQHLILFERDGA